MTHVHDDPTWVKSSYSHTDGCCVEVAFCCCGQVKMRDSKDQGTGPELVYTPGEWDAFLRGAKDGEFD